MVESILAVITMGNIHVEVSSANNAAQLCQRDVAGLCIKERVGQVDLALGIELRLHENDHAGKQQEQAQYVDGR